jgi:ATP phosphoribosyltransferase
LLAGVREIMDLGFGMCKLQVQVPEHGEVQTPEQLVGRNVVTSFTNLAENYFRILENNAPDAQTNGDRAGATKLRTTIKFVGGSVEAACALGVADGIVDLVGQCSPSKLPPLTRTKY